VNLEDDIALNPHVRERERALLRALLQATDYGILVSDLARQDILANRRLGELFTVNPQTVVETDPRSVRELVRNRLEEPDAFDRRLQEIYSDAELTVQDELELTGERRQVLRRFTAPVRDHSGHPVGRLWTFLDITETRRLEQQVQAQLAARTADFEITARLMQAMNTIGRLAQTRTPPGALLREIAGIVGSALEVTHGAVLLREEDRLAGMAWACGTFVPVRAPVEDPALSPPLLDALLEVGVDPNVAFPLESGAGTQGLVVLAFPGEVTREWRSRFGAVADQIAMTLETARLDAELRAAERRMVEIEKLRTAGALATSVAHDIRNIITPLLVELSGATDPASEAVRVQLSRFSALTHRLLSFGRPEVLDIRATCLREVLAGVTELVAAQVEVHEIRLAWDLPELPRVAADPGQLQHLFVNLCLNAVQAMAERGGTLRFCGRSGADYVEIDVQDEGRGIDPAHGEKLFDPFFTTRSNGFGLGLFSCRRIVEEHGGALTVRSEPGRGSTFTVRLPFFREAG
jgi:signal transduction histidine kinase